MPLYYYSSQLQALPLLVILLTLFWPFVCAFFLGSVSFWPWIKRKVVCWKLKWTLTVNSLHIPKILFFPLHLAQKSLSTSVFSVALPAVPGSSQLMTETESFITEANCHLRLPVFRVRQGSKEKLYMCAHVHLLLLINMHPICKCSVLCGE